MARSLFVTGTDTGVGKTAVTAALLAYWQTYRPHESVAVFKPIQSGIGDREFYQTHFQLSQSPEDITPLWFQHPLAPPIASELEGRPINLELAEEKLRQLQGQYDQVLIEGLGGLGSPVTNSLIVADLARNWGLSTVLVVPVRLGAIGQTVANVALARQTHVNLRGIILSSSDPEAKVQDLAPVGLLEQLTRVPVLGQLRTIYAWSDLSHMADAASNLTLDPLLVP